MWKKISKSADTDILTVGSIITNEPVKAKERYIIQSIEGDYIRAVHADGKISIKGMPATKLITEDWWVQE
jgi:hypothetical protein